MRQITVKVSDKMFNALRERAKAHERTLSQEVRYILKKEIGMRKKR